MNIHKTGKYSNTNLKGVSDPIRIRAHHLLCMQGFQGYGYSKDFAVHMLKVVDYIMDNPSCELDIIMECDEICSHCPHKAKKICFKNPHAYENIKKMDVTVLEKLGILEGSKIESQKILEHVNKIFKTREDALEVCGDCLWLSKCLWFMEKPI